MAGGKSVPAGNVPSSEITIPSSPPDSAARNPVILRTHVNRHFLTLLAALSAAALSAAALLAGYGARRLTRPHPPAQATGPAAVSPAKSSAQTPPPPTTFPPSRSTDTVESLAALDDGHLYARLALWLADATEPDIAAFWNDCYSKKENWTPELSNLLFLHWTRLDPQHAIDSTQGIHSRPQAWWAWACHDPQAALAAAIVDGPGSVDCVAEGIGKFQPDWLLKHFDEIPTGAQHAAISSLSENGGKNPLETLKFLQQQGSDLDSSAVFKAFARDDPWAAVEWAMRKKINRDDPFVTDPLPPILQTLAAESPDELARIAERTPSGSAKLQMEAALFANLIKTDPAAALEQAKATTIPRTAAERYAAIGQTLVQTDPAQALQLAKNLLAACPRALDFSAFIQYPDGNDSFQSLDIPGVDDFMESLMTRQPQQVLEMITALPPEIGMDQFPSFSRQWIQQDLVGYTNWLNQQADPAIHQTAAPLIARQLGESGHFEEAMEWATSVDLSETYELGRLLDQWHQREPEAPAGWLRDAGLPPEKKAIIQTLLDHPR